ncbi:MAG TPA: thioesterase family protein [Pyrinomonadaceae bacterium]|nr:acyl-CoA thioesterase [Chloracidobacterium sp.]MBP9936619.1 acyl-CoA thioesterase [Pyrinomonadaceae bacterium]MBK7802693.1 acyl-CoA thioesterase [Chloracidobacterium sp.]MBK9437548.1 acyl-CoA thioesterase [Chloracidobacterium sp.]MBK9767121.1 acyl-CoA thioesterase [Chloracidobacterium sp.]
MKFSHSFSVDAADIDELGHVNNVAYVRWVQGIAVAHWRDATSAEIQEQFFWVVVRHEIDYKKEALIGDAIVATTWVGEWTGETCERFTEIRRGNDLLVAGRTVWCMCSRETSRPTRISKDLIKRFEQQ